MKLRRYLCRIKLPSGRITSFVFDSERLQDVLEYYKVIGLKLVALPKEIGSYDSADALPTSSPSRRP